MSQRGGSNTGMSDHMNDGSSKTPSIVTLSCDAHSLASDKYAKPSPSSALHKKGSTSRIPKKSKRGDKPTTTTPPQATPPPPPPMVCTVPLAVVFLLACVVIAAVFALVIALPTIALTEEVEADIKESLGTSLQGAMKYVTDPLLKSKDYVTQLKEMIELRPESYACDDSVTTYPGNQSNVNFLFQIGMYALQRTDPFSIFQARMSTRFLKPDGTGPAGMSCVVSPDRALTQYFVNNTHFIDKFTNGSFFDNLASRPQPFVKDFDVTKIALIRGIAKTNTSSWIADSISQSVTGLANPANKYSYIAKINDPSNPNPDSEWVVGMDHNLVNLHDTLLRATPPFTAGDLTVTPTQVQGAHTTLYEVNQGVIMASTHPDVPVATLYGVLFDLGASPSALVNDAYNAAISKCGENGCTNAVVTLDRKSIHTAYRINIPSAKLHLLMVSSVPRSYFFAKADRSFITTLTLSIGCCALIIAGCIGLLIAVRRPINKLKENMMLAAKLQNDQVQHTSSFLRDISELSAVFDGMNQQLLIARSFVPEAVLLGNVDTSINDDDDEESIADTTVIGTGHNSKRQSSNIIISSNCSSIDVTHSSNNSKIPKLFNVAEKRVGVLSLNLVGFHALCAPDRGVTRAHKIHDISTSLLTMALEAAHGERGVMDSFHGDHFVLTFNASRAVSGPLAAAVRTANTFIAAVHESRQFIGAGGIAAGAAAGRAHVGTFGIDGYRRLSVVGDAYRSANMLQQAAVQFLRMNAGSGVREGCMVEDSSLKELGTCAFHIQVVGCLQSAQHRTPNSHRDPPPTAYFVHWANKTPAPFSKMTTPAVTPPASAVNGEWMYELNIAGNDGEDSTNTTSPNQQQQPFAECNKAMIALLEGDTDLCGKLLEQHQVTETKRRSSSKGTTVTRTVSDIITFDDSELTADPSGWEPCWALVRSHYYLIKSETTALLEAKQNVVHVLTKRCTLPWIFFQQ